MSYGIYTSNGSYNEYLQNHSLSLLLLSRQILGAGEPAPDSDLDGERTTSVSRRRSRLLRCCRARFTRSLRLRASSRSSCADDGCGTMTTLLSHPAPDGPATPSGRASGSCDGAEIKCRCIVYICHRYILSCMIRFYHIILHFRNSRVLKTGL